MMIKVIEDIATDMTSPFLMVKNDEEWIPEKPEPDNFCNNVTCVLIVGYVRGGTTMILDTLAETSSNFYLFEPIRNLTESSYAKMPITFFDGKVRNISMHGNLPRVQTEMLNHWFNCDFSKINIGDLKNNHLIHSRATKSYFACIRKSSFPFCIKMLESVCVPKARRIVKVVRLRMKSIEYILRKTDNLKIIYIVRDPRAQIHSLIKSGLLDPKVVKVHSRELCEDMMSDFNSTTILKRAYHNNIFMLKYEDLVKNPFRILENCLAFLIYLSRQRCKAIATESGRWLNRDLNGNIFQNTPQDPNHHGYPDPNHFKDPSFVRNICSKYKQNLQGYGNHSDMVMEIKGLYWPHWMDTSQHGGKFPNNLDAGAEFIVLLLKSIKQCTNGIIPRYFEVINEPDAAWKYISWNTVIDFHRIVHRN
ncbi:CHST1 [Mytilus coruscus]|uniref:CHST1 n=1 Tax=Mytilus coruscus TaxID=42192 RepID=A0A6J8DFI3_MYTCO|nr:CHST1 [Mytilus coruscus]